jgi:hypothetical protein
VVKSVEVPPGSARIAARRGVAVVHKSARELAVVDLKFGRSRSTVIADDDARDVAIDPDGNLVVLRLTCGELEIAPLGERGATATRLSLAQPPSRTSRD